MVNDAVTRSRESQNAAAMGNGGLFGVTGNTWDMPSSMSNLEPRADRREGLGGALLRQLVAPHSKEN